MCSPNPQGEYFMPRYLVKYEYQFDTRAAAAPAFRHASHKDGVAGGRRLAHRGGGAQAGAGQANPRKRPRTCRRRRLEMVVGRVVGPRSGPPTYGAWRP